MPLSQLVSQDHERLHLRKHRNAQVLTRVGHAAAGLNMTEPCSTGIGGDMFCLYYDAATGKVSALNGSGRSAKSATLESVRSDLGLKDGDKGSIPIASPLAVTVPGAAAGWVDTVERFGSGKLSLEQILAPAIALGEGGFPVSEIASYMVSSSRREPCRLLPHYVPQKEC